MVQPLLHVRGLRPAVSARVGDRDGAPRRHGAPPAGPGPRVDHAAEVGVRGGPRVVVAVLGVLRVLGHVRVDDVLQSVQLGPLFVVTRLELFLFGHNLLLKFGIQFVSFVGNFGFILQFVFNLVSFTK